MMSFEVVEVAQAVAFQNHHHLMADCHNLRVGKEAAQTQTSLRELLEYTPVQHNLRVKLSETMPDELENLNKDAILYSARMLRTENNTFVLIF